MKDLHDAQHHAGQPRIFLDRATQQSPFILDVKAVDELPDFRGWDLTGEMIKAGTIGNVTIDDR